MWLFRGQYPPLEEQLSIRGHVRRTDGTPVSGLAVRAYDVDFRAKQPLGSTVITGKDGSYCIEYYRQQFSRAEKGDADLQVAAYASSTDKSSAPLAISAIFYNSKGSETVIDLVIGGDTVIGPAEYDALLADILPLIGKTSPADFSDQAPYNDYEFLVGETGNPEYRLRFLQQATECSRHVKLDTDIFYGLFREGASTDLAGLLQSPAETVERALRTAIEDNIIKSRSEDEIKKILATFSQKRDGSVLKDVATGKPTPFAEVIEPLVQSNGEEFVKILSAHQDEPIENFWDSLNGNINFKGNVEKLQFGTQLGIVTLSHPPLIKQLEGSAGEHKIAVFADLAKFSEKNWLDMIQRPDVGTPAVVPGDNNDDRARNYARAMASFVEDAIPTPFVLGRLQDPEDDTTDFAPLPGKREFATFLQKFPNFDLIQHRLPNFLNENPSALDDFEDKDALKQTIMSFQRVYSVAPMYKQAKYLLGQNLHSSMQITCLGRNLFSNMHASSLGGAAAAAAIYEKAEQNHAMAVSLISNIGFPNSKFKLPSWWDTIFAGTAVEKAIPDWAELFGSLDLCFCSDCRSADGPAAYLVDALHFLFKRHLIQVTSRDPLTGQALSAKFLDRSAKHVLLDRRGDIGQIELTCPNTNVTLPYVDLVIELLENLVSPFDIFTEKELVDTNVIQLLNNNKVDELRTMFQPPLSAFAQVKTEKKGENWTIDEPSFTYRIRNVSGKVKIISRGMQTQGTAQERLADAQYLNSEAYDVLANQVFPLTAPFNLWAEFVHTYLAHLDVKRIDFVESSRSEMRSDLLSVPTVVEELLLLSSTDTKLLKGELTAQPGAPEPGIWNLWGFGSQNLSSVNSIPDPSGESSALVEGVWNALLTSRVDVFLQQTRITYTDLLNLIQVLNERPREGPSITISARRPFPAATCDLSKLQITGLNDGSLMSILIFLRLLQKLSGWTILDLGRAVRLFDFSAMDDFLIRISHVERLMSLLSIPIMTILSFWGSISTYGYTDYSSDSEEKKPESLYTILFRNQTVSQQPDIPFTRDPAELQGTIAENAGPITAALNITAIELKAVTAEPLVGLGPDLNLDNLSILYRHSILAKALGVDIQEYLILPRLLDGNPFTTTEQTVCFVENVYKIQRAKVSITEIAYILLHDLTSDPGIAPSTQDIEMLLSDLRISLKQIFNDTVYDPESETPDNDMKKQLARLGWTASVISQFVGTINNLVRYTSPFKLGTLSLPTIASNLDLKDLLIIETDDQVSRLSFPRVLTVPERDLLLELPGASEDFKQAVTDLFQAPRSFVVRNCSSYSIRRFEAPLLVMPNIQIPKLIRSKVYYDKANKQLISRGAITESEKDTLLRIAGNSAENADFVTAVNSLNIQADSPAVSDVFLSSSDIVTLFDTASNPASRFAVLLPKLLIYVRQRSSDDAVKQKVSEAIGLGSDLTNSLVEKYITIDGVTALLQLRNPVFADSSLDVPITASAFQQQHQTITLLAKAAFLITRFKLSVKQLSWLFEFRSLPNDPTIDWLDLNRLPLSYGKPYNKSLDGFIRLCDLCDLRDALFNGELCLDTIFHQSRSSSAGPLVYDPLPDLALALKWPVEELQVVAGPEGLKLTFPDSYKDEINLRRILRFVLLCQKTCCSAADGFLLAQPEMNEKTSRIVRQCVKSKYDLNTWNTVARPLRNIIREKQRSALLDYLLTHRTPGKPVWQNADDLFGYLLLDVEMGPCQLTSRIKQAISSVQLFVQRCLMNLETQVTIDSDVDNDWLQWSWMKSLPVWSANRRVWMSPENFLEGGVRDDKTTFFTELESELQQGEMTSDTAETAYQTYLEKLDTISSMEVVSFYHQQEQDDLGLQTTTIDTLHIFLRTRGSPRAYYYVRRIDNSKWSKIEKVDVDINGDHLVPIIWNRRLHLFWATWAEKQEKVSVSLPKEGESVPEGQTYWEIKLAWTELKNGKWLAKKMSEAALFCPKAKYPFDEDDAGTKPGRTQFTFKATINKITDVLQLQCIQDNWYPYVLGSFNFNGVKGSPTVIPKGDWRADIFNKLPPKYVHPPRGTRIYNMGFIENGIQKPPPAPGRGGFFGSILDAVDQIQADVDKMMQRNSYFPTTDGKLWVTTSVAGAGDNPNRTSMERYAKQIPILGQTPGSPFSIITAHQDAQFFSQRPFFWQHDLKTYFVEPIETRFNWANILDISNPVHVQPGHLDGSIFRQYIERSPLVFANPSPSPPLGFRNDATALTSPTVTLSTTNSPALNLLSPVDLSRYQLPESIWRRGNRKYKFTIMHHPYVSTFIKKLNTEGVDGLLQDRGIQLHQQSYFSSRYNPNGNYVTAYPIEKVDFEDGLFSVYNWELFMHIPLLIADKLMKNQRFQDAQKWYHYVFDPTDSSSLPSPQRYWHVKRFFQSDFKDPNNRKTIDQQSIENIMLLLAKRGNPKAYEALSPEDQQRLQELEKSVHDWRDNPFNPFLVARSRITAFQKAVVMKYLDNLIAWGDQRFRADTMESINEASQLYLLAAGILGPRPTEIPSRAVPEVQTYASLEPNLDAFGNALVRIEDFIPSQRFNEGLLIRPPFKWRPRIVAPSMLYFCVPKNPKLLAYWDTVADRLFKIRNCMNLQGIVRELRLFEPPIDPMLLIKATAAGLDLATVLNDINAPLTSYKFSILATKATELCKDVQGLGQAFLSAIEKKDSEKMSTLNSTHELRVLAAARKVKEDAIKEATNSLAAVNASKDVVQERVNHYQSLDFMNAYEWAHFALETASLVLQNLDTASQPVAAVTLLFPDAKLGAPTSIGITIGGNNLGKSASKFGDFLNRAALVVNKASSMAATQATYERRKEDWDLQIALGKKELIQIDKQIAAAEIRQAMAEKDLDTHDVQTQNAQEKSDYLKDKFNSIDLYDWMISQLSTTYFQSYQLAYDMAKKAERAFQHELGVASSSYINFGYWDSLKKGLLSADQLLHDLRVLETAYLEQDSREYELTKSVSLVQLDPMSLVQLRETGAAFFGLPEVLFDLDYPGHYMRRIKSVSLSLPCVSGPYTTVSATLSLLKSSVRTSAVAGSKYARGENDPRFSDSYGTVQSIATSTGINDAGVFELNLRDERYMPFERQGAISSWKLTLPMVFKQFEYNTLSDVVINIRYTAREGGEALRGVVENETKTSLLNAIALAENQKGLARLVDVRREFPDLWYRFLNPTQASQERPPSNNNGEDGGTQDDEQPPQSVMTIPFPRQRFPFILSGAKQLTVKAIDVFARLTLPTGVRLDQVGLSISPATKKRGTEENLALATYGTMYRASGDVGNLAVPTAIRVVGALDVAPEGGEGDTDEEVTWLNGDMLKDLYLVVRYEAKW